MNTLKIGLLSKVVLLIVSALFFASLLFPMWQIELEAPQYPEGLMLKLHANKIAGDVDIINGLNHYIGMKTLHTEDFVEFSVLPYIIGFFGLFALALVFYTKRKGIAALFISFLTFGVLAGVDFYRWNYEYGHNLDPNAAIKVPGMSYQPPLIGYKQLLNFGAYSVPDIGGWFLIIAGFLLFVIVAKDYNLLNKFKRSKVAIIVLCLGFFTSCGTSGPEPIKLNVDQCSFCKMSIADGRFCSEIITTKGRIYKFDDVKCMASYIKENGTIVESYFVHNYTSDNGFIPAETAFFIKGEQIISPMRGNTAAFSNEKEAESFKEKLQAQSISWNNVLND